MKIVVFLLFIGMGWLSHAQQVTIDGVNYEVEGERILKNGVDATHTVSEELKEQIKQSASEKRTAIEAANKIEKDLQKTQKKHRLEEKKRKRVEKTLKQKEKAQMDFNKSTKKHESAQKKYDKLKKKGKLSPEDEEKWLSKIEKLEAKMEKAKRKLK